MKSNASITIVDLVDTATYIYYAKDENGAGASTAPSPELHYIGFYDGPPIEGGQPAQPPASIQWIKYIGKDGKDGLEGKKTLFLNTYLRNFTYSDYLKYSTVGHNENWVSVSNSQEFNKGDIGIVRGTITDKGNVGFLIYGEVTKIVGDSVYLTTLSSTMDGMPGRDGEYYQIITSQDQILFFPQKDTKDPTKIRYSIVPTILEFSVWKQKGEEKFLLDSENYFWKLSQKKLQLDDIQLDNTQSDDTQLSDIKPEIEIYDSLLKASFLKYNKDNKKWQFNIEDFIEKDINTLAFLSEAEKSILISSQKLFKQESFLRVGFSLEKSKATQNFKIVTCRMGFSSDMATFSLEAGGFNAAVADKKLVFDSTGLTINNGHLKVTSTIKGSGGQENTLDVLTFDENTGNLHIKGFIDAIGGTFKGKIEAKEGTFEGKITATSGTLQNINIGQGSSIIQINEKGISSNFTDKLGFLISTEGRILANSIELGENATIKGSIQLGKAKIYNPDRNNGKFIEANGSVLLNDNGTGQIGNISFNGQESSIFTPTWSLTPNMATFHNATISGTINTSIFNTNTTQLSGSSFIFKDGITFSRSDILNNYVQSNTLILLLEKKDSGKIKDKLVLVSTEDKRSFFLATASLKENGTIELSSLNGNILEADYRLIIIIGNASEVNSSTLRDWLININASNQNVPSLGLLPNAISFSELNLSKQKELSVLPKIVLGKIPTSLIGKNFEQDNVYGLYASSVFLTGTLTTEYSKNSEDKNNDNLYAGVNTLSKATFSKNFLIENEENIGMVDSSPIIFWAGAENNTKEAIQNAPFQVTSNGTLYARQGYFEGSILTKATVKASTIETATIVGSGKEAALTIKDAAEGIVFEGDNRQYLELRNDSLNLSVPIIFKNFTKDGFNLVDIRSSHNSIVVKNNGMSSIVLEPKGIGFSTFQNDKLESSKIKISIIEDTEKRTSLSIQQKESENFTEIMSLDKTSVKFSGNLRLKAGISFGDEGTAKIEYKVVKNGLDIYVNDF